MPEAGARSHGPNSTDWPRRRQPAKMRIHLPFRSELLSAYRAPFKGRTRVQFCSDRLRYPTRLISRGGGTKSHHISLIAHALGPRPSRFTLITSYTPFGLWAWRLCCCGLPSFDGKGSGAPPFAQGGALGLFAVGARLWRDACNDTCLRALIQCIGTLFSPPIGPLAFYRGLAWVLICNWRPAVDRFSFLFMAGRFKKSQYRSCLVSTLL